jgi:hypothetical protein
MKFAGGNIGIRRKLNRGERKYLLQQASHFIEELKSRSLVSFGTDTFFSEGSFYINFHSERGRSLSLRLSNHEPRNESNDSKPNEQKNIADKRGAQSLSAEPSLSGENEIVDSFDKTEGSDSALHQAMPVTTMLASSKTSQHAKAHALSSNPKKRKGKRILWSWSYDSFLDWEDFEEAATKVVKSWMASDCIGGRMVTWNKNRF